jgi:hypothetical protein
MYYLHHVLAAQQWRKEFPLEENSRRPKNRYFILLFTFLRLGGERSAKDHLSYSFFFLPYLFIFFSVVNGFYW